MTVRNLGAHAAAAAFGLVVAVPASAALMLGYEANTGTLWDVDSVAGASNPRSTLTGLVGIEFGAGGTLFGLSSSTTSGTPNALYAINPSTGASTLIGPTGLSLILEGGLAYDPATGQLWGAYQLATPNLDFFTLNSGSGAATFGFGLSAANRDYSAIAFDGAGNLFVLNTQDATDSLLRVDRTTGAVLSELALTDSGNPANLGGNVGMDFDPVSNLMFLTDNGTKVLYTIDTLTGALTFLRGGATLLAGDVSGLTVVPQARALPEPGTLSLLAAVLVGIGYTRRKV